MKSAPSLYVEGINDRHVIANLMKVRGMELHPDKGPVVIKACGSYISLLNTLTVATKAELQRCGVVGFVLDLDREEDHRFDQISGRISALGYDLDQRDITEDGIIKETSEGRIGVWMMPRTGAASGKLEDFLRLLIPEGDPVLPLSDHFVSDVAKSIPCSKRFRDIDLEKAQIAAWLAVQQNPGLPYGAAIAAHFLRADATAADGFVAWMRRLYDI